MPERTAIRTADGVEIIGDWWAGQNRAALLLHMMPADRRSWQELADRLAAGGWAVLAIDLRGHGESLAASGGRTLDYRKFTDAEHQASRLDLQAALAWLATKGFPVERVALVGASIGANLAITAASEEPKLPAVAALSPGDDYRGVRTPGAVARFRPEQALFLAASDEDQISAKCVRGLKEIKPDAELRVLSDAGHGTTLLERRPEMTAELAAWLESVLK
ncbi:hypothetical protein A3C96_02425 [Candidatus Uhrbacteria bacterium RIFCSPHIGHO2_02_FULL_60_10]|uniref:AB hydrolase-1 domain-containing protein n=1 Tax=Candidatus Uhrbacteria bacterium RIFCSPHIGHO2_02_FULL_60_10 TaxID=1802392 RepID=A0A1F7U3R6_9BACT|nr:MAG: hypothetical protein A3C96_02425 [Candidatus Uhrbacteria bacterium RIFCSPHIGHO2_02_FULL_60_10]